MDTVGKQLEYMNSMMQFVADSVSKGRSGPQRPPPPSTELFSSSGEMQKQQTRTRVAGCYDSSTESCNRINEK